MVRRTQSARQTEAILMCDLAETMFELERTYWNCLDWFAIFAAIADGAIYAV